MRRFLEQRSVPVPFPAANGRAILWRVAEGTRVRCGDVLAILVTHDELRLPVAAPRDGKLANRVDEVDGDAAAQIVYEENTCEHPVILAGMCGVCGSAVDTVADQGTVAVTDAGGTEIVLRSSEASEVHALTERRLLKARKLSLVLDLDHTLLHCVMDPRALGMMHGREDAFVFNLALEPAPAPAASHPRKRTRLRAPHAPPRPAVAPEMPHFLKLRPHVRDFLRGAAELCELHIFTHGTRPYAELVASILDPDRRLFGSRIVSRSDAGGDSRMKDLRRMFPCDDAMALIVDDREDVWPADANLIVVRDYVFFANLADVNLLDAHGRVMRGATLRSGAGARRGGGGGGGGGGSGAGGDGGDGGTGAAAARGVDGASADSANGQVAASGEQPAQVGGEVRGAADATQRSGGVGGERGEVAGGGDGDSDGGAGRGEDETDLAGRGPRKRSRPAEVSEDGVGDGTGSHDDGEAPLSAGALAATEAGPPLEGAESDTQLLDVLRVVREVHRRFFAAVDGEADAAGEAAAARGGSSGESQPPARPAHARAGAILRQIRSEILAGCVVLFSRAFPSGEPNPTAHLIWRRAVAMGAQCVPDWTPHVTHVVALSAGTAKIWKGLRNPHAHVVHLSWIHASYVYWERQQEGRFQVPGVDYSENVWDPSAPHLVAETAVAPADAGGEGYGDDTEEDAEADAPLSALAMEAMALMETLSSDSDEAVETGAGEES